MSCYVTITTGEPRRMWSYVCPFPDVEKGDLVIIPFGADNRLRTARVVEVDPPYDYKKKATKWVAAHVNQRAHDMRMAMGVPKLTEGEPK